MSAPRRKAKNEKAEKYLQWILTGRPQLYFSDELADSARFFEANKIKILETWTRHFPKSKIYFQSKKIKKFNQGKIEKIVAEILQ